MADVSRINPLSISPGSTSSATAYKDHIVQSITMGVRVGENVSIALGAIQNFGWSMDRPVTELHQIEPLPDGTFSNEIKITNNPGLGATKYWPGEVIELIPGKQGAANLKLSRCVLYGSNILSALMYIEKAGTEEAGAFNIPEATSFRPSDDASSAHFSQYVTLIQQVRPVFIKQIFVNPVDGSLAYGRIFEDIWISSMSEELPGADENRAVIESIDAKATRIRPLITLK